MLNLGPQRFRDTSFVYSLRTGEYGIYVFNGRLATQDDQGNIALYARTNINETFESDLMVSGNISSPNMLHAIVDTNKFLVNDGDIIKHRTGPEFRSDIYAAAYNHTHDGRYYTKTEISDFFSGSTSISGYNKSNWDIAYGWGDHSMAGYWNLNGNTLGVKKTIGSIDNYDIGFLTNNTERLTILKGGNVGIGTTAPGAKFQVDGVSGTPSTVNSLMVLRDTATNIGFQMGATADRGWIRSVDVGYSFADYGILNLGKDYVSLGDGADVDQLYLDTTSGNVGIGTTSPTEKLDVNGNIIATNLSGTNTGDVTLAGTGTYLSLSGQAITVDPITESDISDLGSYQPLATVLTNTTASFLTAQETKLSNISVTQAVDLDTMESDIAALDQAVVLKGTWDASVGTFPGGGTAQSGYSYIVSVGGTVGGEVFVANDRIVAILDNASTTVYASNWHKLDYTDQVLSVAGKTGVVTLVEADITDLGTYSTDIHSNITALNAVSNTNTGDETTASVKSLLGITTLSGSNTGDQDLSGKQDTLVNTTNIKSVNGTTLLGSGDLEVGGAIDSVNTQTGVVVLDADDISDTSTTNKYVTVGDITKLGNLSGINTGDQDLSGYATIIWVSNNFASDSHGHSQLHNHVNKAVLDGISSTNVSNWNTAFNQRGSQIAGAGLTWTGTQLKVDEATTTPFYYDSGSTKITNSVATHDSLYLGTDPYNTDNPFIDINPGYLTVGTGINDSNGYGGVIQINNESISQYSARMLFLGDGSQNTNHSIRLVNLGPVGYDAFTVDVYGHTMTQSVTFDTTHAVSGPVAGQMWYDSGSLKYYDGSSTQTLTIGGGSTHNHVNKITLDGISSTEVSDWNTAYGWGDHSTQGYLTSTALSGYATETWVTNNFSGSSHTHSNLHSHTNKITLDGISSTEVSDWNTAYGWGDHSTQGYLTSTALSGYATETWVTNNFTSGGTVGLDDGTALSPSLYFNNDTNTGFFLESANNIGVATAGTFEFKFAQYGHFHADGNIFSKSTSTSSDIRLKKNIANIENALNKTTALRGVYFDWKDDKDNNRKLGLIAQEVEKVIPEVVSEDRHGYKSMDYSKLTGMLIEAIKELKTEINELKNGTSN